jgi:hypothetical protein
MTGLVGKVLAQATAPIDTSEREEPAAKWPPWSRPDHPHRPSSAQGHGHGVAVPGAVDDRTAYCASRPASVGAMCPVNFLRNALGRGPASDLPLYVERVPMSALGEFEFGDPPVSSPALLGLSTGVGSTTSSS